MPGGLTAPFGWGSPDPWTRYGRGPPTARELRGLVEGGTNALLGRPSLNYEIAASLYRPPVGPPRIQSSLLLCGDPSSGATVGRPGW